MSATSNLASGVLAPDRSEARSAGPMPGVHLRMMRYG